MNEAPFAFAGVWDTWAKEWLSTVSCAIVTTAANEFLSPIHDRMPVILQPQSYGSWLAPNATPACVERNALAISGFRNEKVIPLVAR